MLPGRPYDAPCRLATFLPALLLSLLLASGSPDHGFGSDTLSAFEHVSRNTGLYHNRGRELRRGNGPVTWRPVTSKLSFRSWDAPHFLICRLPGIAIQIRNPCIMRGGQRSTHVTNGVSRRASCSHRIDFLCVLHFTQGIGLICV